MQLTRVSCTNRFRRDVKVPFKKHCDASKLAQAIEALLEQNRTELRIHYRDHALEGNWQGYREIHIGANRLVIYRIEHNELLLVSTRTGSHGDLFQASTSQETHWLEIPINSATSRWVTPACTRTRAVQRDFSFSY